MNFRFKRFLNPRSWIRFRLSSLLTLMSLIAVCLGWIGFHVRGKQHEQAVLADLPGVVEVGEMDFRAC